MGGDPALLATHARARVKGPGWSIPTHWEGLPDGWTTIRLIELVVHARDEEPELMASPARGRPRVVVARRDLATYDRIGAAA